MNQGATFSIEIQLQGLTLGPPLERGPQIKHHDLYGSVRDSLVSTRINQDFSL
jgi:hypothetical protein